MASGSLLRQVGQLAMIGFDGPSVPPEVRTLAREFDLGGVVLFARNVEAPGQVAELVYDLQQLRTRLPLWVAVDQEGGRVARLRRGFTLWPPASTLGRSGDEALARRFARALAVELRAVGISMDFAPVLDVHTNPENAVIGDRALSDQAEIVARLGPIIVTALQEAGVAACGKHFPGHGDTRLDSHLDLPLVEHTLERLREIELRPFRAAIDAGATAIMTGHLLVPALDDARPASLSRAIVSGLLREELGFGGVVVSDDLGMRAVSDRYTIERAVVDAVAAGCDAVLLCEPNHEAQARALEALVRAVETGELPPVAVEGSQARHRRAKERLLETAAGPSFGAIGEGPPPLSRDWRPPPSRDLASLLGCEAHRAIADEMANYL
jgi:beta-N-acetylhexosaminidase